VSELTATALFASRLRAKRAELGLTQAQVGQRIGLALDVAAPRINRYEKGQHTPDLDTAERLANELGVPLPYLVARDEALAQLIEAFASLTRKRQAKMLRVMQEELARQEAEGVARKLQQSTPTVVETDEAKARKATKRRV